MKHNIQAEELAAQRFQLLSPLLSEGLDQAKSSQIKAQICRETGLSERTLRRYLKEYQQHGFGGLKPKPRGKSPQTSTVSTEVLEEAILLRREVPGRSIRQIIELLEWENKVSPGTLKRSTLQDHLLERGYGARQLRMYTSKGVAARRFQQRSRNALWQSDIKFGSHIISASDGTRKQAYLVLFVDDATRFIVHGQWYDNMEQFIVQDAFRQAILKYGVPGAVYFDNGKQYRTKWMSRACAKLGIRLLFTKPYSPESKGKTERINRYVDHFLDELGLEKPMTLDQLNTWFQAWLSECYQAKPHSALKDHASPEVAYRSDPQALRYVDSPLLADAFLHADERKVDKAGCISFMGKKYEVGILFIGRKVLVIYDPADITELTIEYEGHSPWKAYELVIGPRAGTRPPLPESMQPEKSDQSRLLRGAKQKQQERKAHQAPAVSYRSVQKEGQSHV
ncbi:DDE-type integrase/transposase/recombinase [Paenibacillus alginolyticus]|uniref:DDE-type integrase/transposase/recombinase n=1 Tax=Paenibacillus alginolyticus TaxID=59839 RepID=UPI0004138057|nr:DDE-type integrase/transposase/recombinase [Paenibacillus alginolyticus]MCY9669267.1 DDE-type integrase/transposase/recombinase [Paenibacillus alginolyticus]